VTLNGQNNATVTSQPFSLTRTTSSSSSLTKMK
jgi:hypothetical protein